MRRYFPLGAASLLTVWTQTVLYEVNFFILLGLGMLWLILVAGWLARIVIDAWQQRKQSQFPWELPYAALVLILFHIFSLPTQVIWLFERPFFEGALSQPPFSRMSSAAERRIGSLQILQVDKAGSATRFVISENRVIASGSTFGYAHCPHGCGATRFPNYWLDGEGTPDYLPLGGDWYAWTQGGSDF